MMDSVIEKFLYEFDEDEECDSTDLLQDLDIEVKIPGLSDLEMQGEEKDVANAVILLFHKLSRMDTLGFKVVSQASKIILCFNIFLILQFSQLAVVSYILEVCREWELITTAQAALKTGLTLAAKIYGRQSLPYKQWSEKRISCQKI